MAGRGRWTEKRGRDSLDGFAWEGGWLGKATEKRGKSSLRAFPNATCLAVPPDTLGLGRSLKILSHIVFLSCAPIESAV